MKIWKLHIFWAKDNGKYHLHHDPKKKLAASTLTAGEVKALLKETAESIDGPRHTPEELNRLIEVVRKANSPEPLYNLPPPEVEENARRS